MADLPTPFELAEAGRVAFNLAIDPSGSGAIDMAAGSRNDAALSAMTAMSARVARYAADRVAQSRVQSATGDDLDALVQQFYGATRKPATPTTGFLRLTRPGTTTTVIPVGSRFAAPGTGGQPAVVFAATTDVSSSATSVVVPVQSVQTGDATRIVGPSAVTSIQDTLPDSTWILDTAYTPATPFGGGSDAESDDTLRRRVAQIADQADQQRGTYAAVLAGALAVPGVATATVIEPLDGTLVVYAGDAGDNLPSTLQDAVTLALRGWRAFGVPALVRPYNRQVVQVTATIHMSRPLTSYDQTALLAAASAAVTDYFDARPYPDEYFQDAIVAALFRAHAEVQHVVMTAPSADVEHPTDAGYGAITALNRYRVEPSSLALTFAGPVTA